MKKIYIPLIIVVILGGSWYFISPLFFNEEINEALPVLSSAPKLTQGAKLEILAIFKDRIEKGDITNNNVPTEEKLDTMTAEEFSTMGKMLMEMSLKDTDVVMEETMPKSDDDPIFPITLTSGSFKGVDSFHKGSGDALIIDLDGTRRLLRLENFSVTNGPDLRVYLSSHSNPTSGSDVTSGSSIELSKLKGNKGNQNYEIPDNIDIDDFNSVVIYCKPFRVVFATASLR